MNFKLISLTTLGLAAGLALGLMHAPASAQAPDGKAKGKGGGFIRSNDPRVQNRTYHFADTNEDLPYCVFVSSKVSKDKKNPLIISLHGLGIGPGYHDDDGGGRFGGRGRLHSGGAAGVQHGRLVWIAGDEPEWQRAGKGQATPGGAGGSRRPGQPGGAE